MKGPSKQWKRIRQASLEAAHRHTFRQAQLAYNLVTAVCVFYVVGFIRFNYFEFSPVGSSPIEMLQIGITALALVLILVLAPAVLVLLFLEQRYLRFVEYR